MTSNNLKTTKNTEILDNTLVGNPNLIFYSNNTSFEENVKTHRKQIIKEANEIKSGSTTPNTLNTESIKIIKNSNSKETLVNSIRKTSINSYSTNIFKEELSDKTDAKESNEKLIKLCSEEIKEDLKVLIQEAIHYKKIGNDLFNKKNYSKALEYYKKSLIVLNIDSEYNEILNGSANFIKIECLNNISICFLLKKEYEKVLDFTQQVIF